MCNDIKVTPKEWRERRRPFGARVWRSILISAGFGHVSSMELIRMAIVFVYYDELGEWEAVADAMDIDLATLYRWRAKWKEGKR